MKLNGPFLQEPRLKLIFIQKCGIKSELPGYCIDRPDN